MLVTCEGDLFAGNWLLSSYKGDRVKGALVQYQTPSTAAD